MSTGAILDLKDVVICDELKASFVSISKFDEKGFTTVFGDGKASIYYKDNLVLQATKCSKTNLYVVHLHETPTINNVELSSEDKNYLQVVHQRLGHLSLKNIKQIPIFANRKAFIQAKNLDCEVCNLSKAVYLPHKSLISNLAKSVIHRLHADLSGKISFFNLMDVQYFLLLIDEFSRFTHVVLLKHKRQVPACMKKSICALHMKMWIKIII